MKITLDLPEIDGYEYTGEYRKANEGEVFLMGKFAESNLGPTNGDYLILKKKEPEYKTIGLSDHGAVHINMVPDIDYKLYVSINALEDALEAIRRTTAYHCIPIASESVATINKLKELLK